MRHFIRTDNKIFVQFHFETDAITATTKTFTKPSRSESEPKFNVESIEGYVSNPWAPQMSDLDLYYLLQELTKDEEKSVDAFHTRDAEIKEILEIRQHQTQNPLLKFSIFDPLRNDSARKLRLQRVSLVGQKLQCFHGILINTAISIGFEGILLGFVTIIETKFLFIAENLKKF